MGELHKDATCVFGTNSRGSSQQNSSCVATFLSSHKPPKKDGQNMLDTAREVRTNAQVTFSHGLLHMDSPVLIDQQGLDTSAQCNLKDLPRAMDDKDGERERENPDYQHNHDDIYVCNIHKVLIYLHSHTPIYLYINYLNFYKFKLLIKKTLILHFIALFIEDFHKRNSR